MDIPNELKTALESQIEGIKQKQLSDAADIISRRYRTESGRGKKLLTADTEALAYSMTRMPATFGAVLASLQYVLELSDIHIESLIDAGAGTGAASWATDAVIDLKSITCVEREPAMMRLGKRVMESNPRLMNSTRWVLQDMSINPVRENADLVIASYALNEMDSMVRLKVVENLWEATDAILLIVEPGTPECYIQLKEIRMLMISKGAHIIAPCPHEDICEITNDDWCHFTCRISRSKMHRLLKSGDAPYEDEKFNYLALSKVPVNSFSRSEARILRHPQIGKGHVKLTICTKNGIQERTIKKSDGTLYKLARGAKCGDDLRYSSQTFSNQSSP